MRHTKRYYHSKYTKSTPIEKRVCTQCGKRDERTEVGRYYLCYECTDPQSVTQCPVCGYGERKANSRNRMCGVCREKITANVADGKMLPLREGETPRCVYPDCLSCPMPDCMFDNSTLYVMGISLEKETPFTCIRCGAEVKNVLSNYCGKCNAARHNEEERRAALLYGDRRRR